MSGAVEIAAIDTLAIVDVGRDNKVLFGEILHTFNKLQVDIEIDLLSHAIDALITKAITINKSLIVLKLALAARHFE
jgi:hypothetical protein